MPLSPGTTLGPYSVTAKIGEGGMGEVYRARDTKLDRDVALKVLPEAFTSDPDRLARFEREAKVLVSLNHPQHRWCTRPGRVWRRQGARSTSTSRVQRWLIGSNKDRSRLMRPGTRPRVVQQFSDGRRATSLLTETLWLEWYQ